MTDILGGAPGPEVWLAVSSIRARTGAGAAPGLPAVAAPPAVQVGAAGPVPARRRGQQPWGG